MWAIVLSANCSSYNQRFAIIKNYMAKTKIQRFNLSNYIQACHSIAHRIGGQGWKPGDGQTSAPRETSLSGGRQRERWTADGGQTCRARYH